MSSIPADRPIANTDLNLGELENKQCLENIRTNSSLDNEVLFCADSKSTVLSDDEGSLDALPYAVRKDLLVRELESSDSMSELEEEKSEIEINRNSLLIEIDGTISEIQDQVKNAKELEKEKRATEEECNALRERVIHLQQLLKNQNSCSKLDIKDQNENLDCKSTAQLFEEAEGRNRVLEKQINQLRTENEELIIQIEATKAGLLPSGMDGEVEALRKENEQLQKLLEMSEESEDNLSHELKECEHALKQLQNTNKKLESRKAEYNSYKQQLEEERDALEEELDRLKIELNKVRGKSKDANETGSERNNGELESALEQSTAKCSLLEKELFAKNKKIESLELEVKKSKIQRGKDSEETSELIDKGVQATRQLRAALEKLNKENAALQDSLEKAEKEANTLKAALEAEKVKKDKVKSAVGEKDKKSNTEKANAVESNGADKEQLEALHDEKNALKSECKALSETIAKVVNEKRAMDLELTKLKEDKENLTSIVSDLETSVQDLEKIKTDKMKLEEAYIELRAQHDDLQEKQTATNESYRTAKEKLDLTLKEKGELEKKATNLDDSMKNLQNKVSELQQTVTTKNSEIATINRTFEEKSKTLSVSLESKQTENKRLSEENKIHLSNLKKNEEEKRFLAKANQSWEPQIKSLRVALNDMKEELKSERTRNSGLEQSVRKNEDRAKKAEEMVKDLESSSARSSDMAMEKALELSKTKRTLEKKIEKLLKENTEMKKKLKGISSGMILPNSERSSPGFSEDVSQIQSILPLSSSENGETRSSDTSSLPDDSSASVVHSLTQRRRSIDEQLIRDQLKQLHPMQMSESKSNQPTATAFSSSNNSSGSLPETPFTVKANGVIGVTRKEPERVQVIAREERPLIVNRSQTVSPNEWTRDSREVIVAKPLVSKKSQENYPDDASNRLWQKTQNYDQSRTRNHFSNNVQPSLTSRGELPPYSSTQDYYNDKSLQTAKPPDRPPPYEEIRKNSEKREMSLQGRSEPSGERYLPSYQDATRSKPKVTEGKLSPNSLDRGYNQQQVSTKLSSQNHERSSPDPFYQERMSPTPVVCYQGRANSSPQIVVRKSPVPSGLHQDRTGFGAPNDCRVRTDTKATNHVAEQPQPVTTRVKYEPIPVVGNRYTTTNQKGNSSNPTVALQAEETTKRRSADSDDVEQAVLETGDDYQQEKQVAVSEHWV